MHVPCHKCGELTPSKTKTYVLCSLCTHAYLYNLESMAKEALKKSKENENVKKEYNKIYSRIKRSRDKLIDIPRTFEKKSYTRDCLKCEREFIAYGKFNRLCFNCHQTNMELEDW